jgi:CBS domain-containing protein
MAQQMRALMAPPPVALPGTASVHEAARAIVVRTVAEAQDPATTTLADLCSHAYVTVPPTASVEQAVRRLHTPAMRRVPVVDGGRRVDMGSLGDLAVEREPDAARGKRSGVPPVPHRGQTRTTDPPAVSAAHEGEKPMEAMREETQAEEPQIGQERAQSEARLGSLAVLQRRIRELLPTLPAAVALGHQAPVRDAIEVMRQKQLSCVLVVERGQLVGVFTERDVVTKVAGTPLDVDHVPLRDVMQPDPECLQLDDELVYALHQMLRGAYRHVPVVDEQRRPTALVSLQTIIDELVAAFPHELLNLPPSPAHAIAPTPEGA